MNRLFITLLIVATLCAIQSCLVPAFAQEQDSVRGLWITTTQKSINGKIDTLAFKVGSVYAPWATSYYDPDGSSRIYFIGDSGYVKPPKAKARVNLEALSYWQAVLMQELITSGKLKIGSNTINKGNSSENDTQIQAILDMVILNSYRCITNAQGDTVYYLQKTEVK